MQQIDALGRDVTPIDDFHLKNKFLWVAKGVDSQMYDEGKGKLNIAGIKQFVTNQKHNLNRYVSSKIESFEKYYCELWSNFKPNEIEYFLRKYYRDETIILVAIEELYNKAGQTYWAMHFLSKINN